MASGAVATDPEHEADILSYVDPRLPAMKQEAAALWVKRGEICNLEGFQQHSGECVNDMVQMFFTSSDVIRTAVQRTLIQKDFSKYDFRHSLQTEDERAMIDPEALGIYMRAFQTRFLRHYLNEEMLCMRGEEKARDLLYRAKGRNTKQAMTALKRKQEFALGGTDVPVKFHEYTRAKSAFRWILIPTVVRILARVFSLKQEFQTQVFGFYPMAGIDYTPKIAGFIFGVTAPLKKVGHALCLYECGGKQFLYENNRGPYRFEWRALFECMEARKKVGRSFEVVLTHVGGFHYLPMLYFKEEKVLLTIESGKWYLYKEDEHAPMKFPYGTYEDGRPAWIDLSETGLKYGVDAIMPIYGTATLVKRMAEPKRKRGGPITGEGATYGTPRLTDPILAGLLTGGGSQRRTTRRLRGRRA